MHLLSRYHRGQFPPCEQSNLSSFAQWRGSQPHESLHLHQDQHHNKNHFQWLVQYQTEYPGIVLAKPQPSSVQMSASRHVYLLHHPISINLR